jgi:hypothetical protein
MRASLAARPLRHGALALVVLLCGQVSVWAGSPDDQSRSGRPAADCHALPPEDEEVGASAADQQRLRELVAMMCLIIPDTAIGSASTATSTSPSTSTHETSSLIVNAPAETHTTQDQPPGHPHTASHAPEPATLVSGLVGGGLLALVRAVRRRRRLRSEQDAAEPALGPVPA